jgi:perosamine synthetase
MMIKVPVYQPLLAGNERKYVNECLDSTWISSKGPFIARFEEQFAQYIGVEYATSVSNGTVGLHLALVALGIEAGDEVIVPTLTYVASANAISYVGGVPVFVDSLSETWQMDPEKIERQITKRTKAIMVVHLYGHPCDMGRIMEVAQKHHLFVIEDCAEAFGAYYKNQHVGTFGDIAVFSFFGNKTITTGEGGMVVTNSPLLHSRSVQYKGQGVSKEKPYWHDVIGYNYRMTNICAAIGLAQLERADVIIAQKRSLADQYQGLLEGLPITFHQEVGDVQHAYWMCSILVEDSRDLLMHHLASQGIETRPLFYPIHSMPMYQRPGGYFPVADNLGARGISLPSWPDLQPEQVEWICEEIRGHYAG